MQLNSNSIKSSSQIDSQTINSLNSFNKYRLSFGNKIHEIHSNKRKNKSLGREFSDVGLTNPANWKYRFGDAYDRSSRTHLGRRELAAKRRNRLKHEVEEQITRELSDEQSI